MGIPPFFFALAYGLAGQPHGGRLSWRPSCCEPDISDVVFRKKLIPA